MHCSNMDALGSLQNVHKRGRAWWECFAGAENKECVKIFTEGF